MGSMTFHPSPSALFPPLPPTFFARPAEQVAPDLIGCRLVRRQADGQLLWGVIVETEAYCQSEPACHGHRSRSPGNDTLFGEPGHFYVYVSYGIHHCVNVVTGRADWANGVLLRAACLPGEPERIAAGPGLLARRFGLDRRHDRLPADPASGLWLAPRPASLQRLLGGVIAPAVDQNAQIRPPSRSGAGRSDPDPERQPQAVQASRFSSAVVQTGRIGIRQGQELPWRWYLRASRSVSRRAPGDRTPRRLEAWTPGAD